MIFQQLIQVVKMECLRGHLHTPTCAVMWPRRLTCADTLRRKYRLRAEGSCDQNDPLLLSAIDAASLRFHESRRTEPLFIDEYAGCLVPSNTERDLKAGEHHYCLATKIIDDKLLQIVNRVDGLKQVVLFTNGMDTRPYRLNWPASTMIYDVSPERVFRISTEKLQGVGAKIPRSCLFFHVPVESQNILQSLCSKGFNGNWPSIWAIQGLPLITLSCFEEILSIVSSLAMDKSLFLGELPTWLAETDIGIKLDIEKWIDKVFTRNGFQVETICYNNVARSLGRELAPTQCEDILFLAQQLRFSDDQMETWRREFQRIENEGDEEGFEEL